MRATAWRFALVLGLSAACGPVGATSGGQPFSPSYRDREGKPLSQVHSHARASARTRPVPVAIGVTETELHGRVLDTNKSWVVPLVAVSEPAVEGGMLVVPTATEFVAVGLREGRIAWRLPSAGRPLFGIDDDGKRTVLTLGRSPSEVLVVDRQGEVVMRAEAPHLLGVPAIRGSYVFVPWRDQFVSVLEIGSGAEVGRLVLPRQTSHALVVGDEVYLGEQALLRFDADVASGGPARGMWLTADAQGLPGGPQWFERGTRVQPLPLTARAFSRVFARPAENSLERREFAASYFRLAMGFDADTRALRWVAKLDSPVLGGGAALGGFLFCTSDGRVLEVASPDGGVHELASFATTLRACVVGPGDHLVRHTGTAQPYHEQLSQAVLLRDPQMVAGQTFLLEQMRYLTEPSLTQTLIDVIEKPLPAPGMVALASELLAERRTGAEFMLAALKRPYDYLAGNEVAPPLGPLARALSKLNEPEAAPLLAAHLNDIVYDGETARVVAEALSNLAGPEQVPELRTFFVLNHASVEAAAMVEAVNDVADTLLRLDDAESVAVVQAAARSPMTHPTVKAHIEGLFDWDSPRR